MARAKCQYDRNWVDTNTAYKEVVDGKNLYWCSEDCHKAWKEQIAKENAVKLEYDEIIAATKSIFGYNLSSYALIRKEITVWESLTTKANIISYLKENKEWLSRIMSKEFSSDFHRVKYFSTVISSKLHDYRPKIEVAKVEKEVDMCGLESFKYKQKNTRRGLDFLEEV